MFEVRHLNDANFTPKKISKLQLPLNKLEIDDPFSDNDLKEVPEEDDTSNGSNSCSPL